MNKATLDWLMKGDPSVRFQTMRDLMTIPEEQYVQEQMEIEKKGWGKRFLGLQDVSGMWGGGLYSPKWISTHYTLLTLKQLGLHPGNAQAKKACKLLLDEGIYEDGGINFFSSMNHSETCVTGMVLSMACYFNIADPRILSMVDYLVQQQMPDGGWNCESYDGARHSSFHTTISVLEGLMEFDNLNGTSKETLASVTSRAHEFLLRHHLFRSDRTNSIVNIQMTRCSFPTRWRYDFMRALDYFQSLDFPHDPRFCDAIQLLKKKERHDRWPLQQHYSGRIFFEMEKVGRPSRVNTLRAHRILKWWNKKSFDNCD